MGNTITYKQLFNLNVFHHYFLDDGTKTIFNDKTTPEVFSGHNVTNYLHLSPSLTTEKLLKENKILFQATTSGASCLMATKSYTDLSPKRDIKNVILNFLIYVKDPLFGNYTEHSRGVSDVYYFANHSDTTSTVLNGLSKLNKLSDTATALDSYKVTYSSPKNETSAYQTLMSTLSPDEQRGLFGVVSVKLENFLNNNKAPETPVELKIVLKNRKTSWVYVDKKGAVQFRKLAQPFVKRGKITITNEGKNYRMAMPSDPMAFPKDQPIETRIYI